MNNQPAAYNRPLRRYGNIVGLTVALTIIASNVAVIIMGQFFDLSGSLADTWTQIIYSLVLMAVPSLIMPAAAHRKLSATLPAQKVPLGIMLPILGAVMGANIMSGYLTSTVSIGNYDAMVAGLPVDSPWIIALTFTVYCAVPAVFEELSMRGVVLGLLRPFGDGFAIIASSAVFGLMHGNLMQAPGAFVGGLIYGFAVVRTGSLLPGMLAHFANNLVSTLLQYFIQYAPQYTMIANVGLTVFLLVLLVFCCAILAARYPDMLRLPKREGERLRYGRFYGSAGMIVLYILFALLSLLTLAAYGV